MGKKQISKKQPRKKRKKRNKRDVAIEHNEVADFKQEQRIKQQEQTMAQKLKDKREQEHNKQMHLALEILSYSAFFQMDVKIAAGRAKILGEKELEETFTTYSTDCSALQWEMFKKLHSDPELCNYIVKQIRGLIEDLPPETRELFHKEKKNIDEQGKEALRIPDKFIKELDNLKEKQRKLGKVHRLDLEKKNDVKVQESKNETIQS